MCAISVTGSCKIAVILILQEKSLISARNGTMIVVACWIACWILLGSTRIVVGRSNSSLYTPRTFVFVSGWPQSGTSLVQQLFTVSPSFSTMVSKCFDIVGKAKCARWNNEGQWLLGQAPGAATPETAKNFELAKRLLVPGAMCVPPLPAMQEVVAQREPLRSYLESQWSSFWDLSKPFLVEKSPQLMLKIPLLRQLFPGSPERTKYLIVIKHPASLNIAVPKGTDWLTHDDKPGDESVPRKAIPNSFKQLSANVDYFIDFLSHGQGEADHELAKAKARRTCSLGWIPAMEQLALQLRASHNESLSDLRILRYEQFERPSVVCRALFDFVYSGDVNGYRNAIENVCNVHFPTANLATTYQRGAHSADTVDKTRGRLVHDSNHRASGRRLEVMEEGPEEQGAQLDVSRRKLRLHTMEASPPNEFSFRANALAKSVYERLQNYFELYRHPAVTDAQREELKKLDGRMKHFGYRIAPRDYRDRVRIASVFDDFDLVSIYNQRALRTASSSKKRTQQFL